MQASVSVAESVRQSVNAFVNASSSTDRFDAVRAIADPSFIASADDVRMAYKTGCSDKRRPVDRPIGDGGSAGLSIGESGGREAGVCPGGDGALGGK